jgi:hypothetical protein
MASVMVDRMKCFESSDSADDIYLIVFRGRTNAPFDSNVATTGPGSEAFWGDFDDGEVRNTDRTIANFQADAVYAVMMVDKDDGKDIAGDEVLGLWRAQSDLAWKAQMFAQLQAGHATSSAAAKQAGFNAVKNVFLGLASIDMDFPKGNDDRLGPVKRLTITPSTRPEVTFFSPESEEDAKYSVRFKVA